MIKHELVNAIAERRRHDARELEPTRACSRELHDGALDGETESRDGKHVLNAAAKAALLATTDPQRLDLHGGAQPQRADAFGNVQLVTRDRDQVDVERG